MLNEFMQYLQTQVDNHSIYVWGAQGQADPVITEEWIRQKETSSSNANRAIKFWKKQCDAGYKSVLMAFDCSGLGMYWLYNINHIYSSDMTADSMRKISIHLVKADLRKGDWVFRVYTGGSNKGRAYHMGYVVDEELNVIESKGRDDGVVKRPLNASGTGYWNAFGRPQIFSSEIEAVVPVKWTLGRILKRTKTMMTGEDVKNAQQALLQAGYSLGKWGADGKFGDATLSAVKSFQKAKKLTVDGKIGKQTCTALGGVWIK